MRGHGSKRALKFCKTALLFYENRALSFPKKGTFSPKVEGHLPPMPPRFRGLCRESQSDDESESSEVDRESNNIRRFFLNCFQRVLTK